MMDVMNLGVPSLFWTIILIGACTLLINLITKRFISRKDVGDETVSVESDVCASPSCVRCSQRASTLMKARTRLTYFTMTGDAEDTALRFLMSDIEKSYNGEVDGSGSQSPSVFQLSALPSQPFFDEKDAAFASLQKLAGKWQDILEEFNTLYQEYEKGTMKHWRVNQTPTGQWAICHLVNQGIATEALELCPRTWNVVKACPEVMLNSVFGNVAFSVVFPGTTISPHYGSTNIRLRCHLGLRGADWCRLEVGGESRAWQAGRLLLFDDSFRHAVMTSQEGSRQAGVGGRGEVCSDEVRVVLLLDLWHPNLTSEVREMLSYAFSSDP